MPDERYHIVPRTRATLGAYGHVWPAEGRTVTAAEVGVDVLQRVEADPKLDLERVPDPAPKPPPKPKPKPTQRRRPRKG